jgi:hypothetical protein
MIAFVDNTKLLILYPLLANLFLSSFAQYITLFEFQRIAIFSMFFVSAFGFLLFIGIIYQIQILPENIVSGLNIINDSSSGSFRLNYVGLNSLYILFPISLSSYFSNNFKRYQKYLITFTIIFSLLVILLSGRRALIITTFLSPFLLLFYSYRYKLIKFRLILIFTAIMLIIFSAILSYFYFLQLEFIGININLIDRISDEFSNESTRVNQFPFLLNYFITHPWGSGFGVILPNSENFIRDSTYQWNFELTYLQLLCNTGIFGLLFYIYLFISLFNKLRLSFTLNFKTSIISLSIMNGIQLFFIASFTNPYIASFESMIIIFLPIYIIKQNNLFKY